MSESRLLIVDDEKNIRLTLSQTLDRMGVTVDTAVNGEEALEKLALGDYHLVLLDLRLPGMDGMEVLRQLRDLRPEARVIIITAYGTVESAVEAMKLGAVDFIQKPFSPKEIRDLVQRVIDRPALDGAATMDYEAHIEMAKKHINDRHFDMALEHVQKAIALDSERAEAFNLKGALHDIQGDDLEAKKNYRAALALDPSYKPAKVNLERGLVLPRSSGRIDLGDDEQF